MFDIRSDVFVGLLRVDILTMRLSKLIVVVLDFTIIYHRQIMGNHSFQAKIVGLYQRVF